MSEARYASAIGFVMWCTHPDVSYALSVTRRNQANPGMKHWNVVNKYPKYLRRTKDMFLVYDGDSELVVNGLHRCQTDRGDTRSQSGYVFILNDGAVRLEKFQTKDHNTFNHRS